VQPVHGERARLSVRERDLDLAVRCLRDIRHARISATI